MKKKKYSLESLPQIGPIDHIRIRPSMYIGQVNSKGLINVLKDFFTHSSVELKVNTITLLLNKDKSVELTVDDIINPVYDSWTKFNKSKYNPFPLGLILLNGLSSEFSIELFDSDGSVLLEQVYQKGKLVSGIKLDQPINCQTFKVKFTLDKDIWGKDFEINNTFLNHEIAEFSYLHQNVKYKFNHFIDDDLSSSIYFFKKGLKDRLDIEKFKGLGNSYFDSHIHDKIDNIEIEIAFAFREYTVDEPFLKSFVNDYYTSENGSHVDGLLKGLTYGVMKYFQKHKLTQAYKISEKGIKEHLIAIMNIRMETPVFSGCVKNKLANPEIIEPIANYVSDNLFAKIEQDEESTKKLIRKFEI